MKRGRSFKSLSKHDIYVREQSKFCSNSVLEKGSLEEYKLAFHQADNSFCENRILWTALDVANFLRCSKKHVYNLVWKDEIPYVKIGGLLRFNPEQLRAWLHERTTA